MKSLESDHSKQKLKENLLLGAELQGMRFANSWLFAPRMLSSLGEAAKAESCSLIDLRCQRIQFESGRAAIRLGEILESREPQRGVNPKIKN